MPSEWVLAFSAHARFDFIKLTFPDVHPIHRRNVDETISAAYQKVCIEHGTLGAKLPKMTTLDPSPNKPNGKYIVEAYGIAAELVHHLPAGWMQYLTYMHVKCFFTNPETRGVPELKEMYETKLGPRSFNITYPGSRSQTDKGNSLPSLRSGSRKSGSHGIWYQRMGQPIGGEVRFRDEQVTDLTFDVLDLIESRHMPDTSGWGTLLWQASRKAGEFLERDFLFRNETPADWLIPMAYHDCRFNCVMHKYDVFKFELANPHKSGKA